MSNKKTTTLFALLLTIAMVASLFLLNVTTAQLTMETYVYIGATPNPVGVGQEVLLHVGITRELTLHFMGWEGMTVTVTKPDGTTETLGPYRTDSTGGTGAVYRPTMAGNYTLQSHFPQQLTVTGVKMATGTAANTTMLASSSSKLTLVVQQEPIEVWPGMPLPKGYWTRPIDAQFQEWHAISGNWVTVPSNLFARYNDDAPETAHVLWAKQLSMGGLAGGLSGQDNLAHAFECGDAYEGKFGEQAVTIAPSVIIGGMLYYNRFESRGAPLAEQEVVAINLRTGKELWCKPLIGRRGNTTGWTVPSADRLIDGKSDQFPNGIGRRLVFGQVFYWDSFNYHGTFGYLWTTDGTTWMAFDALTGRWIYTITNVPGTTTLRGPCGELLRIEVSLTAGWVALWNGTKIVNPQNYNTVDDGSWRPHGIVYNATGTSTARNMPAAAWEWNRTIPRGLPGSAYLYKLGDRMVGSSTTATSITTWAVSLKPGQEGTLLFNKTWTAPAEWLRGNQSISRVAGNIDDKLIVVWNKEKQQFWGFSTETGDCIWGPTVALDYLDHYGMRTAIAAGKFFAQGMSGILHCFDVKTGSLLWTYSADDPYNQVLWANQWHIRPLIITDGKIYMGTSEHSPTDPKPRGGPFVCVDIETGKEIFRVNGLFRQTDWGGRAIIGDSVIATMDSYDQRIYAIGKGPSAMTVEAPLAAITLGSSLVIRGTVTDASPGTRSDELTLRFPKGVPAVADESMSEWMLYVYKQFPMPKDAVGVSVTIDVLDANGNYRNIGTAVSDADGFFSFAWTPDIEGKYTVIASFAGSKSYYQSRAITAFTVDPSPPEPAEPEPQPDMTGTYVTNATIAIIAAIIAVGAVLALIVLKKRA